MKVVLISSSQALAKHMKSIQVQPFSVNPVAATAGRKITIHLRKSPFTFHKECISDKVKCII